MTARLHCPLRLVGMFVCLSWGVVAGVLCYLVRCIFSFSLAGEFFPSPLWFWIPVLIGGCLGLYLGRYLATMTRGT